MFTVLKGFPLAASLPEQTNASKKRQKTWWCVKQVVCFFQKKVFLIPSQLLSVVHITTGFLSFTPP